MVIEAPLRYPITGIAGYCARAASGHVAVPPSNAMNSRRLMCSPQAEDHIPYHIVEKAVLCITAFWPTRLPHWVTSGSRRLGPYVSFHRLQTCLRYWSFVGRGSQGRRSRRDRLSPVTLQ